MLSLAAMAALGALPAMAADTGAQAKDRKHENEIHERMNERESGKASDAQGHVKKGADQGADAARAGGARAARSYHGAVHAGKKATHRAAKKTAESTK